MLYQTAKCRGQGRRSRPQATWRAERELLLQNDRCLRWCEWSVVAYATRRSRHPSEIHVIFIELLSITDDACELTEQQYQDALATWLCPDCKCPRRTDEAIDITIAEESVSGQLNFVPDCWVALARKSYLEHFGWDLIRENFHIGSVRAQSGRVIEGWCTYTGKHIVDVLGSDSYPESTCAGCGRQLRGGQGKQCIDWTLDESVKMAQSNYLGIVMPAAVHAKLSIPSHRSVGVRSLRLCL